MARTTCPNCGAELHGEMGKCEQCGVYYVDGTRVPCYFLTIPAPLTYMGATIPAEATMCVDLEEVSTETTNVAGNASRGTITASLSPWGGKLVELITTQPMPKGDGSTIKSLKTEVDGVDSCPFCAPGAMPISAYTYRYNPEISDYREIALPTLYCPNCGKKIIRTSTQTNSAKG